MIIPLRSLFGRSSLIRAIAAGLLRSISRSRTLSGLVFCFWDVCRNEHRLILERAAIAIEGVGKTSAWKQSLILHIHCLEKGLSVPSATRRDRFGLGYIEAAVGLYKRLQREHSPDNAALERWAFDVLTDFFEVAGTCEVIDRAKQRFYSLPSQASEAETISSPPQEPRSGLAAGLSFDKLCTQRRSVRWFTKTLVARETIDDAVELALKSPSTCNLQPFRFIIADSSEDVGRMSKLAVGLTCFSEPVPVLIAVVGSFTQMPNARSRHGVYIDGSLATMSLIYALEARGISSCCLVFDDSPALAERARQLLALQPAETVVLLLAAGYSDNQVRPTHPAKKGVKEMRRFLTAPVKPCEVP